MTAGPGGERGDRDDPVGVLDEELVGDTAADRPADPRTGAEADERQHQDDAGTRCARRRAEP